MEISCWKQKQSWVTLILVLMVINLVYSSSICSVNVTVPRSSPTVSVGSFTVYQSFLTLLNNYQTRDIFIYWEHINETETCENGFGYLINYTPNFIKSKIKNKIRQKKTSKNFAKFKGLNTAVGYNFTIYSTNEKGLSIEYSTLNVPSESKRITKRLSLTKTLINENGLFKLSWTNYDDYKRVNGYLYHYYTLFWCEVNASPPYLCTGYVNWKNVPITLTSFNITVVDYNVKKYRFSLSVNTFGSKKDNLYDLISYSSGMIWESCAVLPNNIPDKIDYIQINFISSSIIEMHWTLDCSNSVVTVDGYHLYYCPVIKLNDTECTEPMIDQIIREPISYRNNTVIMDYGDIGQITSLAINKLEPQTTYMIKLTVIFKNNVNEGVHSDPLYVTTEEEDKARVI